MKKWERFTRQEIEQFVKESSSYAQLAIKFGYSSNAGGAIETIHQMTEQLNLNDHPNIRQALIFIGLTPKGGNYARAYELIHKYQIEKFLVGAPG